MRFYLLMYLSGSISISGKVLIKIREQQFEHLNRTDDKSYVTVSMGISWMDQTHPYPDIHALMKAADVQLYAAKQAGRDQLKMT